MKWEQIAENWIVLKPLLRQRWGKVTDRDLDVVEGDRDELIALLEQRYGWDQERAVHEVELWEKTDTQPPSLNRPTSLRKAS